MCGTHTAAAAGCAGCLCDGGMTVAYAAGALPSQRGARAAYVTGALPSLAYFLQNQLAFQGFKNNTVSIYYNGVLLIQLSIEG